MWIGNNHYSLELAMHPKAEYQITTPTTETQKATIHSVIKNV